MKMKQYKKRYFNDYTAIKHFLFVMAIVVFVLFILLLLSATVVFIAFTVFEIKHAIHWIFIFTLWISWSIFNASLQSIIVMAVIGHLYQKKYQKIIPAKLLFLISIPVYCTSYVFSNMYVFITTGEFINFNDILVKSIIIIVVATLFAFINAYYVKKIAKYGQ